MNVRRIMNTILFLLSMVLVTACRLPKEISTTTEEFVDEVATEINRTTESSSELPAELMVQEYSQAWIGPHLPVQSVTSPIPEPVTLSRTIKLTFIEPVSLVELTHQIAAQIDEPIIIPTHLQAVELPTVNWHGEARGALNYITGQLGYSWRFRHDKIEVFQTELGVWTLFVPTINAKWQASVGLSGSSQGDSSGSDLRAQDQVVVSHDTSDYWTQIDASLASLLTPIGTYSINRLSGELTVIDTPEALQRIADWVAIKNQNLTTQVLVNFDLYEIHQSEDAAAGFNMAGFVKNAFGNRAARVKFGSDDKGSLLGLKLTQTAKQQVDASDIELILRKSAGDSRVAKLTSTVIRGLNGMPVPVFFGDETSYLEKREVVNREGTTAVRLLPGKIQDGIAINMLPRILPDSDRIMLNLTVRTSRIKEISRFPKDAGPDDPVIQLPNLESRSALLPVILNSGELLFVAGLDTFRTDDSRSKALAGSESKIKTTRTSLVLLITPYIIRPTIDFSGHRQWRRQSDHSSFM